MTQAILVPDELYARLNSAAASVRRPIEEVAARVLSAGLPPGTGDVPAPARSALRRLQEADDDALWKVWHSQVPQERASRHRDLLERNAGGTLTLEERRELGRLRRSADRLMLERAHAAALLRWRGHAVPLAD